VVEIGTQEKESFETKKSKSYPVRRLRLMGTKIKLKVTVPLEGVQMPRPGKDSE
jgi:hypothetical protein